MEILVQKMINIERNNLTNTLIKAWPKLKQHLDRVYTYYVGPMDTMGTLFDVQPDSTFIKNINEQVANGKDIICLYNISEILRKPTLDKIHNCLPSLNIDPSKIYFFTGALDGPEKYEEYCKDNGYVDRIKILSANIFLSVAQSEKNKLLAINTEYVPKVRSKKFLCFNRVERRHRIILTTKLLINNLIDTSYYSFYGHKFNSDWIDLMSPNSKLWGLSDEEILELRQVLNQYKHLFPMHLTADANHRNNPIFIESSDITLYENSYYSLVTETYFYSKASKDHLSTGIIPAIFFTEKIYKPISMKHPFILVSSVNSLKWLRKFGFKTFSPYINESYDDEIDDDVRMDMIIEEVKRLDKFTDVEWIEWQNNIKAIVEYNFQIYLNLTDYAYNPKQDLDF